MQSVSQCSCRFIIHAIPERIGHGFAPASESTSSLYNFLTDMGWSYPGSVQMLNLQPCVHVSLFSKIPIHFVIQQPLGGLEHNFHLVPISYLYSNISWRPLSRARPCCTQCYVYPQQKAVLSSQTLQFINLEVQISLFCNIHSDKLHYCFKSS